MKALHAVALLFLLSGCATSPTMGSQASVPVSQAAEFAKAAGLAFQVSDLDQNGLVEGGEWVMWASTMWLEYQRIMVLAQPPAVLTSQPTGS